MAWATSCLPKKCDPCNAPAPNCDCSAVQPGLKVTLFADGDLQCLDEQTVDGGCLKFSNSNGPALLLLGIFAMQVPGVLCGRVRVQASVAFQCDGEGKINCPPFAVGFNVLSTSDCFTNPFFSAQLVSCSFQPFEIKTRISLNQGGLANCDSSGDGVTSELEAIFTR